MKRWFEVSKDPNSKEAFRFRNERLRLALRTPIADRVTYLRDLARGKRVLDIGVADHTVESGQSLHRAIASVSAYCLGVDILSEPIEALRAQGYNVRICDISRDAIEEEFEIITCGEVIEHLGNPGALFETAQRNLSPGGRLVMTTPNPFYLARARNGFMGRNFDNVDHVTLMFPSGIAELAERADLVLDSYRGILSAGARTIPGRVVLGLRSAGRALGVAAEAYCETLIYECVRPGPVR